MAHRTSPEQPKQFQSPDGVLMSPPGTADGAECCVVVLEMIVSLVSSNLLPWLAV